MRINKSLLLFLDKVSLKVQVTTVSFTDFGLGNKKIIFEAILTIFEGDGIYG
jgi:hypothetical protein